MSQYRHKGFRNGTTTQQDRNRILQSSVRRCFALGAGSIGDESHRKDSTCRIGPFACRSLAGDVQ